MILSKADAVLLTRLQSNVEADANGCWLWTAGLNMGYGRCHVRERGQRVKKYAHRLMFELLKAPIPPGLQIDHVCRVRRCVNPAHLRVVTQRDNIFAPGSLCQSKALSERTHCFRGHLLNEYRIANGYRFRRCRRCHAIEERERSRARTKLGVHVEEA